jgi:hypothetical protein
MLTGTRFRQVRLEILLGTRFSETDSSNSANFSETATDSLRRDNSGNVTRG